MKLQVVRFSKKVVTSLFISAIVFLNILFIQELTPKVFAVTPGVIFDDGLSPDWVNWSWGSGIDFGNSSPVQSGAKSIGLRLYSWGAAYLHSDKGVDLSGYKSLDFSLYATSSYPKLKILFYDANN